MPIRPSVATRTNTSGADLFGALESRTLMSTSFSYVGVDFTSLGTNVVLGDGVLADDNTVTGTATTANINGTHADEPIDIASMTFGPSGVMSITRAAGFTAFNAQAGTEFRTTGTDYSLGVHHGIYDDGADNGGDFTRFLIERRDVFNRFRTSSGYIAVRTIEVTASGVKYDQDFFKITVANGAPVSVWKSEDGLTAGVTSAVTSWTDDGVVKFGTNQTLIFGRRAVNSTKEEFALYIDADASDGEVAIGTSFTEHSPVAQLLPDSSNPEMIYRGTILAETPGARDFLGITGDTAHGTEVVLSLKSDETYALYHAAEYDAGNATPFSTGTTTYRTPSFYQEVLPDHFTEPLLNTVALHDTNGQVLIGATSTAFNFLPEILQDSSGAERVGGEMVTKGRVYDFKSFQVAPQSVQIDDTGNIFLMGAGGLDTSDVLWLRYDLGNVAAATPAAKAILVQHGTHFSDAWHVIALARDGSVLDFSFEGLTVATTSFTMVNLSEKAGSAFFGVQFAPGASLGERITNLYSTSGGQQYQSITIAGKTTGGDLMYVSGTAAAHTVLGGDDPEQFTVVNLTQALTSVGQTVPTTSGPFFAYETYWNARNLLFLNSSGQVESIWTAPAIERWYVNNLSDIAGATPLVGGLSAMVTSWRGIHIEGLDASGNLHSLWWAPALIGEWVDTNLTDEQHGTALSLTDSNHQAATLATWVGNAGDMHVMAIDVSGATRLYWWSFSTLQWQVINTTPDVTPSNQPTLLIGQANSVAPNANLVFAENSQHEFIRLYSTNGENGDWVSENTTFNMY